MLCVHAFAYRYRHPSISPALRCPSPQSDVHFTCMHARTRARLPPCAGRRPPPAARVPPPQPQQHWQQRQQLSSSAAAAVGMPVVQEWLALVTADDALAATFAADAAASAADAAATVAGVAAGAAASPTETYASLSAVVAAVSASVAAAAVSEASELHHHLLMCKADEADAADAAAAADAAGAAAEDAADAAAAAAAEDAADAAAEDAAAEGAAAGDAAAEDAAAGGTIAVYTDGGFAPRGGGEYVHRLSGLVRMSPVFPPGSQGTLAVAASLRACTCCTHADFVCTCTCDSACICDYSRLDSFVCTCGFDATAAADPVVVCAVDKLYAISVCYHQPPLPAVDWGDLSATGPATPVMGPSEGVPGGGYLGGVRRAVMVGGYCIGHRCASASSASAPVPAPVPSPVVPRCSFSPLILSTAAQLQPPARRAVVARRAHDVRVLRRRRRRHCVDGHLVFEGAA